MNPSESAPELEMLRSRVKEFLAAGAVRRGVMVRRIFRNRRRP